MKEELKRKRYWKNSS